MTNFKFSRIMEKNTQYLLKYSSFPKKARGLLLMLFGLFRVSYARNERPIKKGGSIFNSLHFMLVLSLMAFSVIQVSAQTTISSNLVGSTSTGSGGNGITFAVENTNPGAQLLTDVGLYLISGTHSNHVFELWVSTTSLSGAQPASYPSAGWTMVATVTTGAITTTGIQPLFTGLTHIIPGGATQRFAVVNNNIGPRYASSGANIFTGGGVNLLL